VFHGQDCVEAEREARRAAEQRGAVYVSPYNDHQVGACGRGTACYPNRRPASAVVGMPVLAGVSWLKVPFRTVACQGRDLGRCGRESGCNAP
jgi:hypothetical protein